MGFLKIISLIIVSNIRLVFNIISLFFFFQSKFKAFLRKNLVESNEFISHIWKKKEKKLLSPVTRSLRLGPLLKTYLVNFNEI